jgi:hypothetical protein
MAAILSDTAGVAILFKKHRLRKSDRDSEREKDIRVPTDGKIDRPEKSFNLTRGELAAHLSNA